MTEYPQTELSERELEILRLVATGASNKEVAYKLSISANTVKVHLRNIFGKIGVFSRTEAAMYAVKMGLVEKEVQNDIISLPVDLLRENAASVRKSAPKTKRFYVFLMFLGVTLLIFVGLWWVFPRLSNRGNAKATDDTSDLPPQNWRQLAEMPTARAGFAVVSYAGNIYAIAGESAQGVVGVNERYHPDTNTWEALTPKPVSVADVQAAIVGGEIYVAGGRLTGGNLTDVLEIYNPAENRWERGASLPVALSAYALAAFEGKLYLFGGWDGNEYVNDVNIYLPDSDTWETGPAMPTARAFAGAAVVDGKFLVVGGTDGEQPLSSNEEFSPENVSNPWIKRAPIPEERYGMGVSSIADILYVVGGEGSIDSGFVSFAYFPPRDEWLPVEVPFTHPVSSLGLLSLQTSLFFLGGRSGSEIMSQNLSYQAIYTSSLPFIR